MNNISGQTPGSHVLLFGRQGSYFGLFPSRCPRSPCGKRGDKLTHEHLPLPHILTNKSSTTTKVNDGKRKSLGSYAYAVDGVLRDLAIFGIFRQLSSFDYFQARLLDVLFARNRRLDLTKQLRQSPTQHPQVNKALPLSTTDSTYQKSS